MDDLLENQSYAHLPEELLGKILEKVPDTVQKMNKMFDIQDEPIRKGIDWFTKGRVYCGDSSTADGHYSVVMGLDDEFIYLQDPELGTIRKIARDDFMRVWFDFRGKFLKPNELILRQIIAIYK